MKIIIAGTGKVGTALTRQLSAEGYDVTLIDSDSDVLNSVAETYDAIGVNGNCASMSVLKQAGIEDTDLFIAATNQDEVNLLSCLTAHGLNENLYTIARIRNPEYTEQAYLMRESFALSMTVNPEYQTAVEIERLLRYPGFLKRESFAKGRVEIVEILVDENSKLRDITLSKMHSIVKCKVLVCTVLRDGEVFTPDGNFVLKEGDRIFVTASVSDLSILLNSLGIVTKKAKKVILCGGGRVSYYLAQRLTASKVSVEIIERNHERCLTLSELLPDVTVVNGDASLQSLLQSEGISDCDAIVSVTGLDELNMVISLYSHNVGVPQIVTKLGRIENSDIFNALPLGSVVSPKELCCNTIVSYVRAMQNKVGAATAVHSIANGHAEGIEFRVDKTALHCGEKLRNIKLRENVLIACILHGSKTEIPNGDSTFSVGDTIIIVTSGDKVINQFNDIFE